MGIKREAGVSVYPDPVTMKLYRLFQVPRALSFESAATRNGVARDYVFVPLEQAPLCSPKTVREQHMLIREQSSENRPVSLGIVGLCSDDTA